MSTHEQRVAELKAAIAASGRGWRLEVGSDINPIYATRTLRSDRMALVCGHTSGTWSAGFQTDIKYTGSSAAGAIAYMDNYEDQLP